MLNLAVIFTESWPPGGMPLTVKGLASFLVYSWSGGAEFTRMEESGRFVEEVELDVNIESRSIQGLSGLVLTMLQAEVECFYSPS